MYDLKLKNQWDYHLVREYDMEQAELKGKLEIAQKMIEKNMSIEDVIAITGLTRTQMEGLMTNRLVQKLNDRNQDDKSPSTPV